MPQINIDVKQKIFILTKFNFSIKRIIMWQTTLTVSYKQLILIFCFYLILNILLLVQLANTALTLFSSIFSLLLTLEWWRSFCYCRTIKGEFAIFHHINQIYWHHQRWYFMRRPLLLRYVIILNLKSRRDGKRKTLFLMNDSFHHNDWRTLHYYLRLIELN